ncbi:hypothetical protein MWN63_12485 [Paradonghicola geojensis]|nr:hypothetical protein [Marivivens geojensis]
MIKIFKLPKLLVRRYLVGKKITAFDRKADRLSKPSKSGLKGGMYIGRIDELLGVDGLTERMQKSELRVTPERSKRIHLSWDIPDFLWEAILGSKRLEQMVFDYLGPNARLDDLYIKTVRDGLDSVSEGWHDDNVGYRLKLFMVFDADGHPSGTVVIPTERPHLYTVSLLDELGRMLGKPKKENREQEQRVSYQAGDCLLFDTNIPHRGDYSAAEGVRYCVIAEFIDSEKADALRGKAPCGPGQGKKPIRLPHYYAAQNSSHPLVDQSLILSGSNTQYGYRL